MITEICNPLKNRLLVFGGITLDLTKYKQFVTQITLCATNKEAAYDFFVGSLY